jgi:hypothetical protein
MTGNRELTNPNPAGRFYAGWRVGRPRSLVVMKIETVSVDVLDGELP